MTKNADETLPEKLLRSLKNRPIIAVLIVVGTVATTVVTTSTTLLDAWDRFFPKKEITLPAGQSSTPPTEKAPETGWVFAGYVLTNDLATWVSDGGVSKLKVVRKGAAEDRPLPFRAGDLVRPEHPEHQIIAEYRTRGTANQLAPPWTIHPVIQNAEDRTGVMLTPDDIYAVQEVSPAGFPGNPNTAIWLRVTKAPPNLLD